MFRLLPWSSVIGGDKVTAEEVKMLAVPQQKQTVMDSHSLLKVKRKRADSGESELARGENGISPTKKHAASDSTVSKNNTYIPHQLGPVKSKPSIETPAPDAGTEKGVSLANNSTEAPTIPQSPLPTPNSGEDTTDSLRSQKMDVEKLRQTLESQLSLEILLKHNELRLIDQEMAKCQIALEQLRRCSEIPFPISEVSGFSQSASDGTGFAVLKPGNGRPPISPSPWGVNDGAYGRHYARWLLPDPRFDGGEVEPPPLTPQASGKTPMDARATRGSWTEGVGGPSRSQRSTAGAKLQSLSSGYPLPKDKAGPMIIKRKSDGKMVKLVCIDCRRDNFSSTQGFINHCRIAHNRSFASHDAAAAASGEPVEVDESGAVVGKINETTSNSQPGYVHPLIRAAHLDSTTPKKASIQTKTATNRQLSGTSLQRTDSFLTPSSTPKSFERNLKTPDLATNPSFRASPQTPHLSALMQKCGADLDLLNIVGDALTKTEVATDSSDDEDQGDDAMEVDSTPAHEGSQLTFRSARLPARTVASTTTPQHRPSSRKGNDKGSRKPRPFEGLRGPATDAYMSPYTPGAAATSSLGEAPPPAPNSDTDLTRSNSPNVSPIAMEVNQAPSLVSDDDEYGAASESDHPSPSPSETGSHDIAFHNIDLEDVDEGNTSATTSGTFSGPEKSHPTSVSSAPSASSVKTKPIKRGSSNSMATGSQTQTQQKHVTFVSSVTSTTKSKKDNGKRQRRK